MGTALGCAPEDLWIKRDDLTGLGGGGNKVWKRQHVLGGHTGAVPDPAERVSNLAAGYPALTEEVRD